MPIGAPTPSAPNMAMPVQDIDIPARCGPTDAIDQDTQPVTNWLSPRPVARRANTTIVRLSVGERPGNEATRYRTPPNAHTAAPMSFDHNIWITQMRSPRRPHP